ncbi:MAG: hypothetical protein WC819_01310 [Parcubacteria group bacterium]
MQIALTVRRFKKGEKKRSEYKFPEATYEGVIEIPQDNNDAPIDTVLKGNNGNLPIKIHWQSRDKKIFCITKEEKIHFTLKTVLPTGEHLGGDHVGGQMLETGQHTNWSATMIIYPTK